MATLTSALDTPFTPALGEFLVQVSNGKARLDRRNSASAAWVQVGTLDNTIAAIISNPVTGAQYQFVAAGGDPVVQADQ